MVILFLNIDCLKLCVGVMYEIVFEYINFWKFGD